MRQPNRDLQKNFGNSFMNDTGRGIGEVQRKNLDRALVAAFVSSDAYNPAPSFMCIASTTASELRSLLTVYARRWT
jgi:hypothetical protein